MQTVAEYSAIQNKGKSAHVREACATYAQELASRWGAAYFRRHDDSLELLERCVKVLLRDASAEARAAARLAYHALAAEFPDRVEAKILSDLDERVRARLMVPPGQPVDSGVTSARKRLVAASNGAISQRPQTATKPRTPEIQLHVGQRVRVQKYKTGTVRFFGETNFSTGVWVGVELDAADGKHDGIVGGQRYFAAAPYCGLFVRAAHCVPLDLDDTPSVVAASRLACEHKRFLGNILELLQRQLNELANFESVELTRANAATFTAAVTEAPDLIRRILDTHSSRLTSVAAADVARAPAEVPTSAGPEI